MNTEKFTDLFTLLFWLAQVGVVVIRLPLAVRARRLGVASTSHTMSDAVLLVIANAGMYGLPLLYTLTPWLQSADYARTESIAWVGVALLAAGLWLFWRSHRDLGAFWSPTLQLRQGHQLISHGIYRHIRHPMYAAMFVLCLAQGLLFANWVAGWGGLAAFGILYALRIDQEEAMLLRAFGPEYQALMQRAGRLWPIVGLKNDNVAAGGTV